MVSGIEMGMGTERGLNGNRNQDRDGVRDE